MKLVSREADGGHLRTGNGHAIGVAPSIDLRSDVEPRPTVRRGNQPSRQRQDAGRSSASPSGCAVAVCRGPRDARPEARTPGHLRGYEEERSWWAISRMSAAFGGVRGEPDRVRVHDFIIRDPRHGKAI